MRACLATCLHCIARMNKMKANGLLGGTKRWWLVSLLGFIVTGNLACAPTPAVPRHAVHSSETAWEAYEACLDSLRPSESSSVCNSTTSRDRRALSYFEYIHGSTYAYGGMNYGSSNLTSTRSGNSGKSSPARIRTLSAKRSYADAYRNYLSTLKPEVLAELEAEWRAIADQAEAE